MTCMRSALFAILLLFGCSRVEPLLMKNDCRRTHVLDVEVLPERVEWFEVENAGENRSLDIWCEAVAPAVLRARPDVADTSAVDSLVVVSWNTHVGGGDIERFVRNLRAGRFTNGDSVKHFVLLLQEVYRASDSVPALGAQHDAPSHIAEHPPNGRRRDIVTTASTLGLSLLYVPSMRNGGEQREDRGNAILSTFELDDPEAIELPFERQRRVVAVSTIEGRTSNGRDWKLKLASVHFDNVSRTGRITSSVGPGRYRQAYVLADHFEDVESAVIAGDLNTWSIGLFERAVPLLRSKFDDTPPHPSAITYIKGNMRRRLDYMFFKLPDGWRATYKRAGSQYGSDHYPLVGWVTIAG